MARYRVLETSFINNTLMQPGTELDFDEEPGPNLELVEGEEADGKPRKGGKSKAATPEGA